MRGSGMIDEVAGSLVFACPPERLKQAPAGAVDFLYTITFLICNLLNNWL